MIQKKWHNLVHVGRYLFDENINDNSVILSNDFVAQHQRHRFHKNYGSLITYVHTVNNLRPSAKRDKVRFCKKSDYQKYMIFICSIKSHPTITIIIQYTVSFKILTINAALNLTS